MHEKMYEKAEEIVEAMKSETDWRKIEKNIKKLQDLNTLPLDMIFQKTEDDKYRLSNDSFANETELAKGLKRKWINQRMKEYRCKKKLEDIKEKVLIGTEFTFHHKDFLFDLNDLEKNSSEKGIDIGNRIIADWTRDLQETYHHKNNKKISNLRVIATKEEDATKKFKNETYSAVKINFRIEDTLQDKVVNWKVNFDLDPSCIELQTQPMPYQFFEDYGFCINKLLFNDLNKYGLTADKNQATGGGGHISLDVRTAFFDNAVYLRNFIVLYSCEVQRESANAKSFLTEEQRQLLTASKDETNAPFLFEKIGEWVPFRNFIAEFDRQSAEEISIPQFVENMHNRVYIYVTKELESLLGGTGKVTAGDKHHYQAVNLEHVKDQGRIEMRRFDAQANIQELLKQLDALFEILRMARTNWKISIDKAQDSDYFAG